MIEKQKMLLMLPAGAVTVVGSLWLHVEQIVLLLQSLDFVFAVIQMFEASTQELIVCRSQK